MLQTEVCTIFDYKGESKKVHHVILTPSLEMAEQINERLKSFGDLASDGRPILNGTAPQIVEEVMAVQATTWFFQRMLGRHGLASLARLAVLTQLRTATKT